MSTPIISFDIDGVIAGGGYIPEMDRKPEVYEELLLLDPSIPEIINNLCRRYSVYIISARRFENALEVTRLWLHKKGFNLSWLCGVMCLPSWDSKIQTILSINPSIHIDDSPMMLKPLPVLCQVLFMGPYNDWPGIEEYSQQVCTVYNWQEVQELLR